MYNNNYYYYYYYYYYVIPKEDNDLYMNRLGYSLPPIADFLSLPWQRLIDHALKNRLMESSWLPLHILLCRIIAYALAKNLPPEMVDIETLLSLGVVSHTTRVIADEWLLWRNRDPKINEYMQTHSNLDFARDDATQEWFPLWIIEWIHNFSVNPKTRSGYFPHETMIKNWEINWTDALYQITSWSVAGAITTLHNRFDDLRARRSAEMWKLELDHMKEQIQNNSLYRVPSSILESASQDLGISITNSEFINMVKSENSVIDNKKLGEWILNGYEAWADMVRKKYCEIVWVDNFDVFLREQMDTVSDPGMKLQIQDSFESAIWRKPRGDEFFPAMPGIDLIYKRIWAMKVEWTKERAKIKMERLMANIDRVARSFMNS